jgi:type IV secretion system protein TrbL
MRLALALAAAAALVLAGPAHAQTSGLNPAALIAQYESAGDPTAQNPDPNSTASGLYGFIDATWRTYARQAGVDTTQYPHAYMAPASVQTQVFYTDFNQHGFSDWTCAGCDPKATAAIQAAGGTSAFAQGSTDPASYASLDTSTGLQTYFAGDSGVVTPAPSTIPDQTLNPGGATGGGTCNASLPNGTLTTGIGNSLDQMVGKFKSLSQGWTSAFQSAAQDLLWLLFIIEAGFSAYGIIMYPEAFGDWISWIIRNLMLFTFFQFAINNATTWLSTIFSGFSWLAGQAGSPYTTPSSIFNEGVNLASTVACSATIVHPVDSAGIIICAVLILIVFALLAALLIETLAEAWVITGMAALFLAFGGLRFSRDIAVSCLKHAVGVGFKLLAMSLLIGAGMSFIQGWASTITANTMHFSDIFVMLGTTIVFGVVSKRIPDRVQAIALGSPGSWAAEAQLFRQAAGAAALAAAPALGAAGLGTAALAAGLYGMQELRSRDAEGSAPSNRGSRAGVVASAAGRAIAGAASAEIGNRLGGRYRAGGSAGVRMAQVINNQRRLNAANKPPQGNP